MDDDEKARLAGQGMRAADLLEPGELRGELQGSVKRAAARAALSGLAAVGRLRGPERSPPRARAAAAVDVDVSFRDFDAHDAEAFARRLRHAVEAQAEGGPAPRPLELAALRRSFPPEARELALLIFNCVDLLEDLSEDAEGNPAEALELARKEQLLLRIGSLLAPGAGAALQSFVAHVVELSRRHRGA
jgi:hypothetical protein